jgi:chromosome segregation ATPase
MNPLAKLFSRTPSALDIRLQLKQVERDQWKKRRELDALEQTKQAKVEAAVAAKKAGQQELVQDIFRDMRQIEIDHGYVNGDLRRLSLSKTALTAFLRKVEMLEKNKDHKSLQNLLRRYNSSSIQKTIDQAEVDDDTFGGMLQEILGEDDISFTQEKAQEDAGFAEFDRAIEQMAGAEEAGAREKPAPAATPRLEVKVRPNHTAHTMSEDQEHVEDQIRNLVERVETLKRQIEAVKRDLAELRARAADLKAQGASKDQELQDKQRELDDLIAKRECEETMLEAVRTLILKLLEEKKDLKQQEDETNSQADELEGSLNSMEQEVAAKEQEIAYLRSQLA